ncbi:MAG: hypothetical protein JW801_07040 [Bacteroidales bacterium]|nr:hypothetical protein [Bacteroidales bacterium]
MQIQQTHPDNTPSRRRNRLFEYFSGFHILLKLIPFLFLYLIIAALFSDKGLVDDEIRYHMFATNLIHGHYSPGIPHINIWNGPGYPLFLVPFMHLDLPLQVLRALNAFLLYFSLAITYETMRFFISRKKALLGTVALGLYFPMYSLIPLLYSECLAWFLISVVCYFLVRNFQEEKFSWKWILLGGIALTCLTMVKVIFGNVLMFMLMISLFLMIIPGYRQAAGKSAIIFLIGFTLCLPWLAYTHSLTGKAYYWTNCSGMSLYTMSSPFPQESGDWMNEVELGKNPNHAAFIDSISNLSVIERDEAYREAAIRNIRQHPGKYLRNWIANVGRLLFSYPYSYEEKSVDTYFTMLPNMFIVVLLVFSFGFCVSQFPKMPKTLCLLLLFMMIYLFGSSLLSAYKRMFFITMPYWFLFMSYIFSEVVLIRIRRL